MAAIPAARELVKRGFSPTVVDEATERKFRAPYSFALASDQDDAEIRCLLRENALPGEISLSLEREPDAAAAGSIEGDVHQTICARDRATGRIVGIAARAVRNAFLNGQPARLGYLGQFRIDRRCRHLRTLVDEGFAFCRMLHDGGDARVYLTSIVAANGVARRLLVERRSATSPRFVPIEGFTTLAITLRRQPRAFDVRGVQICTGSDGFIDEIAACLQRNLRRYQFGPCWTAEDLRSPVLTRGLAPEDFVLAVRQGRVVGCVARWDQRAFKQTIVRGYSPALRRMRPFVNLAAPWLGIPALPAVGQPLQFAYLSHVAVDEDRGDVLTTLLAVACRRARAASLDYVVTAFADRDPFLGVVARRFRHRAYPSMLCVAYWPDGEALAHSLDDRLPQPEVAIL